MCVLFSNKPPFVGGLKQFQFSVGNSGTKHFSVGNINNKKQNSVGYSVTLRFFCGWPYNKSNFPWVTLSQSYFLWVTLISWDPRNCPCLFFFLPCFAPQPIHWTNGKYVMSPNQLPRIGNHYWCSFCFFSYTQHCLILPRTQETVLGRCRPNYQF